MTPPLPLGRIAFAKQDPLREHNRSGARKVADRQHSVPDGIEENAGTGNNIAVVFLKHQNIMRSFWKEFVSLPSGTFGVYENVRQDLVDASCLQQKIHSAVANEIFYPSIRACASSGLIPIDDILDQYAASDRLLKQFECGRVTDPETCARYAEWGDGLDLLFHQEVAHVLPEVSPMQLDGLQQRLEQRRSELQDEWDGEWCGRWGESLLWKQARNTGVGAQPR
ncbi:MAG: hypothetical protein ABI905_09645 [Betaproteobacteria bacterium]